ncbi:MAG: histidine--tRNA ligase [Actinomycetota bacterium]|nr:histidine--tRNA ligase [Actinomycetota bacterium]
MTTYRAPKGTYDILPPESEWWRRARRLFDEMSARFGYGVVITPMFEDTEVFARSVGRDSEVVQKQMYTFLDRGGRSVTLRPEATASVVRAVIQAGGVQNRFKGAYWGEMFRYERPQKGRNRQFVQAGIEYLGSASAETDVEVIEFGYRMLESLEVPDVEVRINTLGDPEDRAVYDDILRSYLRDHFDDLSPESQKRIDTNPMRVLDSKVDQEVIVGAPVPMEYLGEDARRHFEEVKLGLEAVRVPFVIDDRLVRGLDYYTRTVWEYIPTSYDAAQNSVGGGGRYDGLFELLGGKPTPAVGLSMGVDRILLASRGHVQTYALDAFVVVADDSLRLDARRFTSELRMAGLRVDMTDVQRSVRAQFKEADRRKARAAIVVGAEWERGEVTAKDLESGEQEVVTTKEIEGWLQAR